MVSELPFGFYLNNGSFEAETYPRAISGAGFTAVAGGITFACGESSLTDSLAAAGKQLTLDAAYSKCEAKRWLSRSPST